ncbi:hypothetical protein SAMN05660464_3159 [Geodermatophilus dictyosporus]|uniref:Uncharacterized protein n=1 Tax=Geodermatophilus dictyosporus TaxID=1523247 RepID=A0A1I5QHV5_9ACTN|nr:hypothetical protein [Geodermatophilus dictyosporus]SFP45805.1 hypothetical protein SAMN05660464_3159 [Geodermatophilus dictyosporus]
MLRARAAGAAALALSAALLTGCQLPDVSMSPDLTAREEAAAPTRAASTQAAVRTEAAPATATVPAAPTTPARPAGDLDTGALTHALSAGDRTVVIDYWTTGQAATWTAEDDKTVQLAAHVEGGDEDNEVLVTRFAVTVDDGTTRALAAEDRGEFALMPPYSYSTALTLPGAAPTAEALTLEVQFDLLVETEPGSERWFRQTVLDTLQLPLLQEDHS